MPAVTTVIPTFRRPAMLRRAVESVLAQTFTDFELAVFDNASGDETASVVAEFSAKDSRVKYFCNSENIGAIPNMILASEYAVSRSGRFHLLCDDDWILPWFIENALTALQRYPDAIYAAAQTQQIAPEGHTEFEYMADWGERDYYPAGEAVYPMIRYSHPATTAMVMQPEMLPIMREAFVKPITGVDVLMALVGCTRKPIAVVKECGGCFSRHSNTQLSQGKDEFNVFSEIVDEFLATLPPLSRLRRVAVQAFVGRMLAQCRPWLWNGQEAQALDYGTRLARRYSAKGHLVRLAAILSARFHIARRISRRVLESRHGLSGCG